jgi:hypothetical protein
MTRAVFACLLLIVPAIAGAQSDDELFAEALLPLPDYLKDGATVSIRNDDGRPRIIQEGTSGLRCSPDGPGPGFLVSCIDDSSGPVLQEFRRLLAQGRSPQEAMEAVSAAARADRVATATPGGMIWILSGESRSNLIPMVGVLVPYATGESTGLPEKPTPSRAWLMCPGTPRAHIMIGPIPYGLSEEIGWQACAPTDGGARSDEALIAEATSPLPEQMKIDATVVATDRDGNRRVLRQGSNSLVCSPDGPADGFQASCTDGGLLSSGDVPTALVEYGRLKARGLPEKEILATITAGVRAGTLASMPAGAMHFILSGADRASAEQLIVVRLPDATEESTGLSTQPSPDHAWLMFPGTHQAHMMIGAPPYGWAENK